MKRMNEFKVKVSNFVTKNEADIRQVYRIGKRVGEQGSYGYIRFCIHRKTGCLRAVKVIDKSKLDPFDQNKNQTERANTEIEILSQLDHPNIMRIFEWFEDPNRYYIISDLYQGGELYSYIKRHIKKEEDGVG